MICLCGEFGVRLEDHFYMGEEGSVLFAKPSLSVDDPFGKRCVYLFSKINCSVLRNFLGSAEKVMCEKLRLKA